MNTLVKIILIINVCFSNQLCLIFLSIPPVYFCRGCTLLLNVCFIPFRFSSVCNYWNISMPSCSILSSMANICSVFICSFVFTLKEKENEHWRFIYLLIILFSPCLCGDFQNVLLWICIRNQDQERKHPCTWIR